MGSMVIKYLLKMFSNRALPKSRRQKNMRTGLRDISGMAAKITHLYDYDIKQADFYVIAKDIDLPPFCGASSLNIIVPEGVKVNEAGGCSHNKLYMMDGYKHEASMAEIVPEYTDVLAEMRNRPFFRAP